MWIKRHALLTFRGRERPRALPLSGTTATQAAVRRTVQDSAVRRQAGRVAGLTPGFRNGPKRPPAMLALLVSQRFVIGALAVGAVKG